MMEVVVVQAAQVLQVYIDSEAQWHPQFLLVTQLSMTVKEVAFLTWKIELLKGQTST